MLIVSLKKLATTLVSTIKSEIKNSFSTTAKSFKDYWRIYGGWKDAFCSAYTLLALGLTAITSPVSVFIAWWEISIDILPNIVGFTIGAYAILVSFGDEKFRKKLAASKLETDENSHPPASSLAEYLQRKPSPFMVVNATFAHMVIVQSLAVALAVLGSIYSFAMPIELIKSEEFHPLLLLTVPFSLVSMFMFIYGLILIFAATLNIFRVSAWWDYSQSFQEDDDQ